MYKLSEYKFLGDYSGLREFKRDPEFFMQTFVPPDSFSNELISNSNDYIIVGRKGTGKSTLCVALSEGKRTYGYTSSFLSFNDDLKKEDFGDFARTQHIDFAEIAGAGKLFDSVSELYDFVEIWKRHVLISISRALSEAGNQCLFTQFCNANIPKSGSIQSGVRRGLKISAVFPSSVIPALARFKEFIEKPDDLPLRIFNEIALNLLQDTNAKHYFFFDELNISHLAAKSDEFELRLALVQDVIKCAAELNDYFAEGNLDVHVVCCLRPEVRDQLTNKDPELSKIVDSNYVDLSWGGESRREHPLMGILESKLRLGFPGTDV